MEDFGTIARQVLAEQMTPKPEAPPAPQDPMDLAEEELAKALEAKDHRGAAKLLRSMIRTAKE